MGKEHFPNRKNIRLQDFDYSSPGAYFLTLCTQDKKPYFWNGEDCSQLEWNVVGANCVRPRHLPLSKAGGVALEELERWNETYPTVSLAAYVVMPNHLHVMLIISADESGRPQVAPTVSRMVQQFKGAVTKRLGKSVWQKSFIDHVIRNKQDYDVRMNYLMENPLKWTLDEFYK